MKNLTGETEMENEEFEQWKQEKKEQKQRFTAMQNLPYKVKVKRAEHSRVSL